MQPSRNFLGAGLLVVLLSSACDRPPSALASDSPDRPLLTQMDTVRLIVSLKRQELIAALEDQLQIAEKTLAADPTDPHQQRSSNSCATDSHKRETQAIWPSVSKRYSGGLRKHRTQPLNEL